MKSFSELVKGDLVGVDHGQDMKSIARVTLVDGDRIDLWVITGLYEKTFSRSTGMSSDYGKESRLVMLEEIPEPTLMVILDIEAKSVHQTLEEAKEYQKQHAAELKAVLSFDSDPNLKRVPEWKPDPNSNREGDYLWREAKREQLTSKLKKVEAGAAAEIKHLEDQAAEYGIRIR